MELTTVLQMAKECNADTLGQAILIIKQNQDMLFEYEDKELSMSELANDIKKNKFKLSDCIDYCIKKMNKNKSGNNNNKEWWEMARW